MIRTSNDSVVYLLWRESETKKESWFLINVEFVGTYTLCPLVCCTPAYSDPEGRLSPTFTSCERSTFKFTKAD